LYLFKQFALSYQNTLMNFQFTINFRRTATQEGLNDIIYNIWKIDLYANLMSNQIQNYFTRSHTKKKKQNKR